MTWTTEVGGHLDALLGGSVSRLRELACSPPGPPEVFAAWRAVEQRFGLQSHADPVAAARGYFGPDHDQRSDVLATIVGELALAVDRAIDGGVNDQSDPLYRPKDFSILTIGGGTYQSWRAARVEPLKSWTAPAGPPLPSSLRDVPTYRLADGTPVLLLGRSLSRFVRRSALTRVNTAAHDDQMHEQNEAERVKEAEKRIREEMASKMERQAAALRGGATGGGWSST